MVNFVRLIILYSSFIVFSYSLSLLLKKSFGKCIPLSFLLLYLILFSAHLLGKLSYFKYIFFICIISSVLIILKKGSINNLFKNKALYIFTFIFFYLYLLTNTKGFSCIDDFYYWGLKVKECIRLDSLYNTSFNAVIPPDTYHPFCTVIDIFFCKILGGFSEQSYMFASSLFSFSFFFCLIDRDNRKNILFIVYGVIISLTISLSSSNTSLFYNCIYADWPLAIVFGYSMFCIYDFDYSINSYVYLSCVLTILLLIKQPAIMLFIFIVLILIIDHIIYRKNAKYLLIFLFSIAVFLLWRINVGSYLHGLYANQITSKSYSIIFSELRNTIFNNYWIEIWKIFITACFTEGIVGSIINISYICFVIALFSILFVISKIKSDKKIMFLSFCYLIGSILYLFGMYVSYCTTFIEYEASRLAEFSRYMQIYVFSGFIILYYIIITRCKEIEIIVCMIITCLFVEPRSIKTVIPTSNTKYYKNVDQEHVHMYVKDIICGQPVLCIAEDDLNEFCFIRYLFGEDMNSLTWFKKDILTDKLSFEDVLSKYKYIYVGVYDTDFKRMYWDKMTDVELYNESLYSLQIDEKGQLKVVLERVFTD